MQDFPTAHTGRQRPGPREARTRDEKAQRTEPIERPTGDGVHRRGAGEAASRAAHHRPDDRPRPPAASGVPVHGCAEAPGGARGHRLRGRASTGALTPCAAAPASTLHAPTQQAPGGGPVLHRGTRSRRNRPFRKVFTGVVRRTPENSLFA